MRISCRLIVGGILISILPSLILASEDPRRGSGSPPEEHSTRMVGALLFSAADQLFLDTIFAPGMIPPAGIRVFQNALGDVVQDSILSVYDLLRIRDITAGRGPGATSYERSEGDLNADGIINSTDLGILRDILLRTIGVPHLIGPGGGQVGGNGITLIFPPGSLDSTCVISVQRYTENQFATMTGVDTKGALSDSAYFMAGFQITSGSADFRLPFNVTVTLDSVPPCAYQGLNGLFAAVPDRDGDGRTELFLINELQVDADSLTLTTKDIPVPVIQSLSSSQIEPGRKLSILGSGFSNEIGNIAIEFRSVSTDSSRFTFPFDVTDSALVLVAPGLPSGQYKLIGHNTLTGLTSNNHLIEILPPGAVPGDIRSIFGNYYVNLTMQMDSVNSDSLFSQIEDTTVRNYFIDLRRTIRADLDSKISFYTALSDSMLNTMTSLAAFIQNLTDTTGAEWDRTISSSLVPDACTACTTYVNEINRRKLDLFCTIETYNLVAGKCLSRDRTYHNDPCWACPQAESERKRALELTDILAGLQTALADCKCRNCGGTNCDECKQGNFIGYGPKGKISGGFGGGGGFGTKGVCVNIKKYKPNECANVPVRISPFSPVPLQKPKLFDCPPSSNMMSINMVSSPPVSRPHSGSIIRVANAPVPYNIVGILNDNGNAFIPQVPFNTKLTFSVYDPVSGFFDPDAGTYTSGSTAGGFDRPMLLFQPNTTIRTVPIHIGDVVQDSISPTTYLRTDYVLSVGASDTSSLLSAGFRSSVPMAFKIEDPNGTLVVDSMDLRCYSGIKMKFDKIGPYRIRISFGTGIQPGSYTFGIHYYPAAPIDRYYMCGKFILDTLFSRFSPYVITDPVTIANPDTIFIEPGVSLEFGHNGSVLSNGVLFGTGSQESPIRLQPFGGVKHKNIVNQAGPIRLVSPAGKEVQP